MEDNTGGTDPNGTNAAAASHAATGGSGTVTPEATVPKGRFDEVYEQKKAAEEKAKILQDALNQTKAETAEEKTKRQEIETQVLEADRRAWKANALRSINPTAASMLDEVGASFTGNNQDEYVTWAKTQETKILPKLASKSSVDGNRSNDTPTAITPEVIAAMSNEKRLEYLQKTLPRVE